MEWLLVAVAVVGGGIAARKWRDRRQLASDRHEELEVVRRLAEEDVTVLGEQLRRLDAEVGAAELDEATRADYQAALDAYESAQRAVPRIRTADEISTITDTLATGRYALACVLARVAGRPVPELRVPCFFNPQHGPSVTDVMWTAPGRGTRRVPACSQDAARLANGEQPEVRTVKMHSRTMPYWEAGAAFEPYSAGYFASTAALSWAFQPFVDPGPPGGYDGGGFSGGFDGGGFGGGFDGGGADGGGGGN